MSELLLAYILTTSYFHLPPGLLSAVCYTESRHVSNKINPNDGVSPSYGACQLKYETAKTVGFSGSESQITDPTINAYYSGSYLSKQLHRYNGNIVQAIAAYNSGTLNVNKEGVPRNIKYVNKVLKAWGEGK